MYAIVKNVPVQVKIAFVPYTPDLIYSNKRFYKIDNKNTMPDAYRMNHENYL